MPTLSVRIDLDSGERIGPGKIALLKAVGETGSISAAGRALGMSYRRAWRLIEELNACFSKPVVTRTDRRQARRRRGTDGARQGGDRALHRDRSEVPQGRGAPSHGAAGHHAQAALIRLCLSAVDC